LLLNAALIQGWRLFEGGSLLSKYGKIVIETMLETKDVVVGNAVKNTILKLCLTEDLITEEMVKLDAGKELANQRRGKLKASLLQKPELIL